MADAHFVPVNAVRTVVRSNGRGCDSVMAVPSPDADRSLVNRHGLWEVFGVTGAEGSVMCVELRSLYKTAQAASGTDVQLRVVPAIRGAHFPTSCIVAVSLPGGATGEARDVVVKDWAMSPKAAAESPDGGVETNIPLKLILNIISLMSDDESGGNQDGGIPRVFLTLRFVGCCDTSDAHRLAMISMNYVPAGQAEAGDGSRSNSFAASTTPPPSRLPPRAPPADQPVGNTASPQQDIDVVIECSPSPPPTSGTSRVGATTQQPTWLPQLNNEPAAVKDEEFYRETSAPRESSLYRHHLESLGASAGAAQPHARTPGKAAAHQQQHHSGSPFNQYPPHQEQDRIPVEEDELATIVVSMGDVVSPAPSFKPQTSESPAVRWQRQLAAGAAAAANATTPAPGAPPALRHVVDDRDAIVIATSPLVSQPNFNSPVPQERPPTCINLCGESPSVFNDFADKNGHVDIVDVRPHSDAEYAAQNASYRGDSRPTPAEEQVRHWDGEEEAAFESSMDDDGASRLPPQSDVMHRIACSARKAYGTGETTSSFGNVEQQEPPQQATSLSQHYWQQRQQQMHQQQQPVYQHEEEAPPAKVNPWVQPPTMQLPQPTQPQVQQHHQPSGYDIPQQSPPPAVVSATPHAGHRDNSSRVAFVDAMDMSNPWDATVPSPPPTQVDPTCNVSMTPAGAPPARAPSADGTNRPRFALPSPVRSAQLDAADANSSWQQQRGSSGGRPEPSIPLEVCEVSTSPQRVEDHPLPPASVAFPPVPSTAQSRQPSPPQQQAHPAPRGSSISDDIMAAVASLTAEKTNEGAAAPVLPQHPRSTASSTSRSNSTIPDVHAFTRFVPQELEEPHDEYADDIGSGPLGVQYPKSRSSSLLPQQQQQQQRSASSMSFSLPRSSSHEATVALGTVLQDGPAGGRSMSTGPMPTAPYAAAQAQRSASRPATPMEWAATAAEYEPHGDLLSLAASLLDGQLATPAVSRQPTPVEMAPPVVPVHEVYHDTADQHQFITQRGASPSPAVIRMSEQRVSQPPMAESSMSAANHEATRESSVTSARFGVPASSLSKFSATPTSLAASSAAAPPKRLPPAAPVVNAPMEEEPAAATMMPGSTPSRSTSGGSGSFYHDGSSVSFPQQPATTTIIVPTPVRPRFSAPATPLASRNPNDTSARQAQKMPTRVVVWCQKHHTSRVGTGTRILQLQLEKGGLQCLASLRKTDGTSGKIPEGMTPTSVFGSNLAGEPQPEQAITLRRGALEVSYGTEAYYCEGGIHRAKVSEPQRCMLLRHRGRQVAALEIQSDDEFRKAKRLLDCVVGQ